MKKKIEKIKVKKVYVSKDIFQATLDADEVVDKINEIIDYLNEEK